MAAKADELGEQLGVTRFLLLRLLMGNGSIDRLALQTEIAPRPTAKTIEAKSTSLNRSDQASVNADEKAIADAAQKFEGLLIQQMTKSMWQSINVRESFLGSREEEIYRDMYNEILSDKLAEGQGVGIKQIIVKELASKRYQQPSSDNLASKAQNEE